MRVRKRFRDIGEILGILEHGGHLQAFEMRNLDGLHRGGFDDLLFATREVTEVEHTDLEITQV